MATRFAYGSHYLWLCVWISAVAFLGFSFTYFGPVLSRTYPQVPPAVHVHGWTFFVWYLLLPLQAGLVSARRVALHRTLGTMSLALALAMAGTGLVVIGAQMDLARQPNGSPFWKFLGPSIFITLVLFAVFYTLAFKYRKKRDLHKRFILLASTGALGAAGFRIVGQVIGFGATAGVAGILVPNVIVAAAMLIELRRGEGVHRVYKYGLPASILAEALAVVLTPTVPGQILAGALAWIGRLLAPLY